MALKLAERKSFSFQFKTLETFEISDGIRGEMHWQQRSCDVSVIWWEQSYRNLVFPVSEENKTRLRTGDKSFWGKEIHIKTLEATTDDISSLLVSVHQNQTSLYLHLHPHHPHLFGINIKIPLLPKFNKFNHKIEGRTIWMFFSRYR